jgi:hypothetical protein
MNRLNVPIILAMLSCLTYLSAAQEGKHLFILSGQSNMAGLREGESFVPAVEKAFGADKVIVVKDAHGGQPIRRWHKKWKDAHGSAPEQRGDLYDQLMEKVDSAIDGEAIATVTFLWMQGERDAREQHASVYAASFKGLLRQLEKDLGRRDLNVVIGRLSDFDMANEKYPEWTRLREVQVKLANSRKRAAWVNTDDLNDGFNRKGKAIKDDLHYSVEGYRVLRGEGSESRRKAAPTESPARSLAVDL